MVRQIAKNAGFPDLRVVEYPAPIALDSAEVLKQNIEEIVVPGILDALTKPVKSTVKSKRRGPQERDIVLEGTCEEIQAFFHEKSWTDGLPIFGNRTSIATHSNKVYRLRQRPVLLLHQEDSAARNFITV